DPDEIPRPPEADAGPAGGVALDLPAGELRAAIGRVAFAAARDDTRPVFRAVRFACGPDGLTPAATDGLRPAPAPVPRPPPPPAPPPPPPQPPRAPPPPAAPAAGDGASPERELLVPARAVAELARLLGGAATAHLATPPDARSLRVATGDTTLVV